MTTWEAFGWMMLAVVVAAILTVIAGVWDAWMERRGWRGWKRP